MYSQRVTARASPFMAVGSEVDPARTAGTTISFETHPAPNARASRTPALMFRIENLLNGPMSVSFVCPSAFVRNERPEPSRRTILRSTVLPEPELRDRLIRLWDRALHLGARIAYLNPQANPSRHGVELVRDVPYRRTGRRGHLLDVYVPKHGAGGPALLYVHGGAFALLSKETHRLMALAFAGRGYTVFLANYRIGPRRRYPAPLEAAASALIWVADHAGVYGADPNRIILAGESAGGNLITALT